MNCRLILSIFAVITLVRGDSTDGIEPCPDGSPMPALAFYSPKGTLCKKAPCIVHSNTTISMEVSFTAGSYIEGLKVKILATSSGVTIPWPISGDPCDEITTTTCPISEGEVVVYDKDLKLAFLPEVPVGLTFSLSDTATGSNVTCFKLNVQVKNN